MADVSPAAFRPEKIKTSELCKSVIEFFQRRARQQIRGTSSLIPTATKVKLEARLDRLNAITTAAA
jgi:ABC-type thiamine transport system substrate-binding protein